MKIEEIDKNFAPAKIGDTQFFFVNVRSTPFSLEGFPVPSNDRFLRLPLSLEGKINDGAFWNGTHMTAGGAVRFRTDSKAVAIRAVLADSGDMNHMPRAGSAGFDLYMSNGTTFHHMGTAQPSRDEKNLERVLTTAAPGEMRDWILDFPLYGGTTQVELGFLPGASIEAPTPHKISKPILFYGSSITQGGCASRPGNCYSSMLCREVDAEQINLGFSGCGKGEPAMAEFIASLNLSAFVYDYDHNAPNADHLRETHEPFFRIIREKHPHLPVIFMSKCDIWPELRDEAYNQNAIRRDIIRTTFRNAVDAGDRNVYFIDGENLFGKRNRTACTVDRCHPNDLGFYRMYEHVLPVLKTALGFRKGAR